jgi:hypothetical protein
MAPKYTPRAPSRPVPSGLRRHYKPSVCASHVSPGRLNDDHDIVLARKNLLHRTVLAHLAYNLPRRLRRAYSLINFLPGYPPPKGSLQSVLCEGNLLFSRPAGGADTRFVVSAVSRSERLLLEFIPTDPLQRSMCPSKNKIPSFTTPATRHHATSPAPRHCNPTQLR